MPPCIGMTGIDILDEAQDRPDLDIKEREPQ